MEAEGQKYAVEFWLKLTEAARKDGRLLDPLWRGFTDEDSDEIKEDGTNEKKDSAHFTAKLILTDGPEEDEILYDKFRSDFTFLPIANIPHESFLQGETWESLLEEHEHAIKDPNTKTVLRQNAMDMFSTAKIDNTSSENEGQLVVPRLQLLFIEISRCKEELYGRDFRKKLEFFDVQNQTNRLDNALSDPSKEQEALNALNLLRTQWPNPSLQVLKATRITKILRRGFKSGSPGKIQLECQHLYTLWKDMQDLGNLTRAREIRDEEMPRIKAVIQKAAESLIKNNQIVSDRNLIVERTATDTRISNGTGSHHKGKDPKSNTTIQDLTFEKGSEPRKVAPVFQKYGLVVITECVSSLDECLSQSREALNMFLREEVDPLGLDLGAITEDILPQLRHGRIDISYGIMNSPKSPIARIGRILEKEIPELLFRDQENSFHLLRGGIFQPLPRNRKPNLIQETETWRRDHDSLFPDCHGHPTHCFTAYIPLASMSSNSGSEEFALGTHVNNLMDEGSGTIVQLDAPAGAAIIFDSRLLQRCRAHQPLADTPMLYFTFARKWYLDMEEFQRKRALLCQEHDVSTKLMILSRLRQMVTDLPSKHVLSLEETYGHPHFTNRFDLLLLNGLLSDDPDLRSAAMMNMAAVVHFCTLSEGDKETAAREFVYSFSQGNHDRKIGVLHESRSKAQAAQAERSGRDYDDVPNDVAILYDLAASILFEESILLRKLGFVPDESGICCLLAMLKAHAARGILGCIGVSESRIEEAFTSWWHASQGRFTFSCCYSEIVDETQRGVLVVFSGMCAGKLARPEWTQSLEKLSAHQKLDILHVVDPAFSLYCQDPECSWKGCDYYLAELLSRVSSYRTVIFLGEDEGASAALRFSMIADMVIVFNPLIDIPNCKVIPRSDFPKAAKLAFQQNLMESLKKTKADIIVHYGKSSKVNEAQIFQIPHRDNIRLVPHDYDGPVLSEHLQKETGLSELLELHMNDSVQGNI